MTDISPSGYDHEPEPTPYESRPVDATRPVDEDTRSALAALIHDRLCGPGCTQGSLAEYYYDAADAILAEFTVTRAGQPTDDRDAEPEVTDQTVRVQMMRTCMADRSAVQSERDEARRVIAAVRAALAALVKDADDTAASMAGQRPRWHAVVKADHLRPLLAALDGDAATPDTDGDRP